MDHLIFFMTERMSLKKWADKGLFQREIAIYRELAKFIRVTLVSYGHEDEQHFLAGMGNNIRVLSNIHRLGDTDFIGSLSQRVDASTDHAVVKCNQTKGAHLAALFARQNKLPFIARAGYLQSDFVRNKATFNFIGKRIRLSKTLQYEKEIFESASVVVVSTQLIKSQVVDEHVIPPEKIRVVPNYVDTAVFKPSGKPRNTKLVIYIGRLESQKNLFAFIEACAKVQDIKLIMVGEGSQRVKLEKLSAKLKLEAQFYGQVPNNRLPDLLNTAAVFVLPSYYEGHPKSLIEAMATGIPVLGTDVPGIREAVEPGVTGMLSGTHADEMAETLRRLLDDEQLRADLGDAGARFAERHYSLHRIVAMELENIQLARQAWNR
jgi:glycosyltransferase involved in cell wall biosynthesis